MGGYGGSFTQGGAVVHHRRTGPITRVAIALIGALAGTVACASSVQAARSKPTYYVSVGDSYSVGYQPGLGATPGYTATVARTTRLTLVNFGCAGATTTSILTTVGCPDPLPHTGGAAHYPTTTQAAAAEAFLRAHRGHVGLITVLIGGNDITACALAANPATCVAAVLTAVKANVVTLAEGLRAAAGSKVPMIGLTYPDVILGDYIYPSQPPTAARIGVAQASVTVFKSLFNPALSRAYALAHGRFVDVTAATGAYTPLTRTVTLSPYGSIPSAVASVCTLTWFCAKGNIHATTKGYTLIGKLILAKFAAIRLT
jgi:lysophospholipase L1-like esterase